MAQVLRSTGSGLVLAEEGQDESQVSRALKQIDRQLVLQKAARANIPGGWAYKVLLFDSDDRPPSWEFWWADEFGNPLPLSSGLIDKVNSLRRDAPNKGVSVDEHNARQRARAQEMTSELTQQVIDDHRAKVERGRVSVSVGTRSSKPEWLKKNRGRIAR